MYAAAGWAKTSATVPVSTGSPRRMTSTSSATSATTPMSWVMSRTASERSRPSVRSRSRMPACTVTSSAVVGSSAMSATGSPASAIAIIARCSCPPESSCGYAFRIRRGSRSPADRSSSSTRAETPARSRSVGCARTASAICVPIDSTGVNEFIGSWNTTPMPAPRTARSRSADAPTSSSPRKRTLPVTRASGGSSPSTLIALTDLPDPDSPTSARTRPGVSVKETSRTTGSASPNATRSPSTSSSGALTWRARP